MRSSREASDHIGKHDHRHIAWSNELHLVEGGDLIKGDRPLSARRQFADQDVASREFQVLRSKSLDEIPSVLLDDLCVEIQSHVVIVRIGGDDLALELRLEEVSHCFWRISLRDLRGVVGAADEIKREREEVGAGGVLVYRWSV